MAMGRAPCCDHKAGLKKGAWTADEDAKLVSFIQRNNGHGSWRTLPQLAGLERCGKSCRLRWTNYLRPNIKRGNFSPEEERIITHLHALLGSRWSSIASHLPGRTDNEVKNHWNTHLKKRLSKMGIDPATHLPIIKCCSYNHDIMKNNWLRSFMDPFIIGHMTQWELARMEAEARLAKEDAASCTRKLLDYLIMRQNCIRGEEIPHMIPLVQNSEDIHPYSAAASDLDVADNCAFTLQSWEDISIAPLTTQVPINGTDHSDLDLDVNMIPSSSSSSPISSHHQLFQGAGHPDHQLDPSLASNALEMPAHDYDSLITSFTGLSEPHHLSSSTTSMSFLPDLLTVLSPTTNGVASDYLFALSNSTQSCEDSHDYWASMLNLVDTIS